MTPKQHTRRHVLLHAALDELAADWTTHMGNTGKSFCTKDINLKDFIAWSCQEAKCATPLINSLKVDYSDLYHKRPRKSRRVWNLEIYPIGPVKRKKSKS